MKKISKKLRPIVLIICCLLLLTLYFQSTTYFRINLARYYIKQGSMYNAAKLYERILRKNELPDENNIFLNYGLNDSQKYQVHKYLAEYYLSKIDFTSFEYPIITETNSLRAELKDKVIAHYKVLEKLKTDKQEDYFLLYYLDRNLDKLADVIVCSGREKLRVELPEKFLKSPLWQFYLAKALARKGDWQNAEEIFLELIQKFYYLPSIKEGFEAVKKKQIPEGDFFNFIAIWKFDEGAGCIVNDSSGIHKEGKINGAEWVEGVDNYALNFNGYKGDFVDMPKVNFSSNFTIIFWTKISDFKVSKYPQFLGNNFLFSIGTNSKKLIQVVIGKGKVWDEPWIKSSQNILAKNSWHFVALTYDGEKLTIYVDGKKVASAVRKEYNLNTDFYIGRRKNEDKNYAFNGVLDEVLISNEVLSQGYIKSVVLAYKD